MKKRLKAIVLGGTDTHIALIKELKSRGYYTILVDYDPNPPAKVFADTHCVISTLDKDKVLECAIRNNVNLVVNACLDQPISTACYVSEQLKLPTPFSYKTALSVTNKEIMKQRMIEFGISTAKHIVIKKDNSYCLAQLKFPLIIKPADATGSLGISKAYSEEEFETLLCKAFENSKSNTAIVEEYNEGMELNIYCFVYKREVHLLMITEKFKTGDIFDFGVEKIGSIAQPSLSKESIKAINDAAERITSAFEIENSPLLIQAFIKNDKISVIEIATRLGGGISFETIQMQTNWDILKSTVNLYTGDNVDLDFQEPKDLVATNYVYMNPGIFKEIVGLQQLVDNSIIEKYFVLVSEGKVIKEEMSLTRRKCCSFIVKGKTRFELFNKVKNAFDTIKIFDIDGNSLKREDIYLREKTTFQQ
jgi:carbamoylphosphate synthase large subunit